MLAEAKGRGKGLGMYRDSKREGKAGLLRSE